MNLEKILPILCVPKVGVIEFCSTTYTTSEMINDFMFLKVRKCPKAGSISLLCGDRDRREM